MCAILYITSTTYKCLNYYCHGGTLSRNICYLSKAVNSEFNLLSVLNKTFKIDLRLAHNSDEKDITKDNPTNAKPKKKKKERLTYITLVDTNNNVTVTTLEDATKLAQRRDLKLMKIKEYEAKSDRPTYKFLTTAQLLQDEKKSKSNSNNKSIKGTKLLSLSSKINENDLNSKVKNIIKWLANRNEVKVVITNDNGAAETVYERLVSGVNDAGRIVQKREKGSEIRFQILPPKNATSNTAVKEDAPSVSETESSNIV